MTFLKSLLLSLALAAVSAANATVAVGESAPDFSLLGSDGKTHSLAEYKGKTVVLEWTNHLCPFVKKHYKSGNMQAQQKKAKDKGVVWLSVVSSAPGKEGHVDAATATRLSAERDAAPTAVLMDEKGEVGRLYDAKTTPHMFVINSKGKLVYMGAIDSVPSADPADIAAATQHVSVALDETLAGKPVTTAVTKPYGCSVKYAKAPKNP